LRRSAPLALAICFCLLWAGCKSKPTQVGDTRKGTAPPAASTPPPPAKIAAANEKQVAYAIELKGDGAPMRVREDHDFHSGDRFRFVIKPGFSAYVYMLNRGTGESKYSILFPLSREVSQNPIRPDAEQPVPGDSASWMKMNSSPGEEDFVLIVSMVPLPAFTDKSTLSVDDCERALASVDRQYHPASSRRFEDGDWVKLFGADPGHDLAMILRIPLKHS
jgi:hypothetical protein